MKKRVLIAIVVVLAVVLMAQTGAWAGKLQAGSDAPVVAAENAGARPQGTTTGDSVSSDDDDVTVEVLTGDVPEGPPDGASFYEVTVGTGDTLSEDVELNVEVGPDGSAFYWDGSEWVELDIVDGVVTVPAGAPNPIVLAVVSG